MLVRVLLAVAALIATPAAAEWQQASSKHFIVHADGNAKDIRALTERLERFDALLRLLHTTPDESAKPANRLTVFVVNGGQAGIQRICGGCRNVAGFYVPRASGAVVFTPRSIGQGGQYDIDSQLVLFHEYAHHFLQSVFTDAYPAWFLEGYPEFVATVRFEKDLAIVGHPAFHRARALMTGPRVSLETMFSHTGRQLSADERSGLYGRGWLLTHMIKTDPARAAQFNAYLAALNKGTPSLDAARTAFGDFKTLDRAMETYLNGQFKRVGVRLDRLGSPIINLRPLTAGEAAMIDLRMASVRGTNRATATELYAKAVPVAARFPSDAFAQSWAAKMAFDAWRDDEAEGAADRALAIDPGSTEALLYKARVHLRRAWGAKSRDASVWREARSWIVRANKLNPDEAAPLVLYHQSFRMAREKPSPVAVAGLYRAMELVPQDKSLRMTVARQALAEDKLDIARYAVQPLAYDPHAAAGNPAARLLQLLDARDAAAAAKAIGTEGSAAEEGE